MKQIFLLFTALILSFNSFANEQGFEGERKKIDLLLEYVKKTDGIFWRNGDKHTAKKAASHMKFKLHRATSTFFFFSSDKKFTAKEFIDKIASKSSTTGKPYYIEMNGAKEEVGIWLHEKLKIIEKGAITNSPQESTKK